MKPGYIHKTAFNDPLFRRRRRLFMYKLAGIWLVVACTVIGLIYAVFFSPIFRITDIRINGLNLELANTVRGRIDELVNAKILKFISLRGNSLFFNASNLTSELMREYPELLSAKISSKLPHLVLADFKERTAIGIWCTSETCVYFDELGLSWGNAPKSSGQLLMVIEDKRSGRHGVDSQFLQPLRFVMDSLRQLGLGAKRAEMSDEMRNDFRIYTAKDFPVMFSLDSDIQGQLHNLEVFLDQKKSDFNPQYIDLRMNGRIYYK